MFNLIHFTMWYDDLLANQDFVLTFSNLYCRWLDESKYEDINDYKEVLVKAIQKALPDLTITDVKAKKRPFGLEFTTPSDNKRWQLYHTSRTLGVKRIG